MSAGISLVLYFLNGMVAW